MDVNKTLALLSDALLSDALLIGPQQRRSQNLEIKHLKQLIRRAWAVILRDVPLSHLKNIPNDWRSDDISFLRPSRLSLTSRDEDWLCYFTPDLSKDETSRSDYIDRVLGDLSLRLFILSYKDGSQSRRYLYRLIVAVNKLLNLKEERPKEEKEERSREEKERRNDSAVDVLYILCRLSECDPTCPTSAQISCVHQSRLQFPQISSVIEEVQKDRLLGNTSDVDTRGSALKKNDNQRDEIFGLSSFNPSIPSIWDNSGDDPRNGRDAVSSLESCLHSRLELFGVVPKRLMDKSDGLQSDWLSTQQQGQELFDGRKDIIRRSIMKESSNFSASVQSTSQFSIPPDIMLNISLRESPPLRLLNEIALKDSPLTDSSDRSNYQLNRAALLCLHGIESSMITICSSDSSHSSIRSTNPQSLQHDINFEFHIENESTDDHNVALKCFVE